MYKHLENVMCKELQALEEKYRNSNEMSEGDIRRIDLLVHSLKSLATYNAMKDAEEMQSYGGNSYMSNGNSYMNNNSYMNGNARRGYMSRDMEMSGHYPYPMYPEERRW